MCAPSAGTASMRASPASFAPGGSKAGTGPAGVPTSVQRLARLQLRMGPDLGHGVDARVGDLRRIEARDDLLGGHRAEGLDDDRAQVVARRGARRVGGEARVGGELGPLEHARAERPATRARSAGRA